MDKYDSDSRVYYQAALICIINGVLLAVAAVQIIRKHINNHRQKHYKGTDSYVKSKWSDHYIYKHFLGSYIFALNLADTCGGPRGDSVPQLCCLKFKKKLRKQIFILWWNILWCPSFIICVCPLQIRRRPTHLISPPALADAIVLLFFFSSVLALIITTSRQI